MGVSVEVKGGWRINTFLFLLTGSQAVLLPWSPVILGSTGLSPANVGVVMGVIHLVGSMGVLGCLAGIRRTRSGAARRLMLLALTASASAIYITAVLLLPASAGGNTCIPSSSASSAISNSHVFPSHNKSELPSNLNTLTVSVDLSTSAPVNNKITTTTQNSTDQSSTAEHMDHNVSSSIPSSIPSTTGKHAQNATSDDSLHAKTTIVKTTTLETVTLNKSDHSSTSSTTQENSTHEDNNTSRKETISIQAIASTAPPAKGKPNKSKHNGRKDKVGTSTPTNINGPMTSPTSGQKISQTPTINTNDATNASQSSFQGDTPHPKDIASTSLDSMPPLKTSTSDIEGNRPAQSSKETPDADETSVKTSSFSSDGDYYYDDDENYSDSISGFNSKLRDSFSPYNSGNRYNQDENPRVIQAPPPPPGVLEKDHGDSRNVDDWFGDYSGNPLPQKFGVPETWQSAFQKTKSNYRVEPKKGPYFQDQRKSQVQSNRYRVHDQDSYDTSRNGHRPQSHPRLKNHGKSGLYRDQYQHRNKRSVHPQDQSLTPAFATSSKTNIKERETLLATNNTDTADSNQSSSRGDNIDIRSFTQSINSPVGIQTGVAILLILGSLVSAGIEVGVAQLWHCYAHGYDEGGIDQDILQRTISHTFQLSVYAGHKAWSGITSGAWVVSGGIIAGLVCMMGVEAGIYGMLGGVQLALGLCAVFMVLVIPVPYGSVDPPKIRRPLSLYLDDEVLREGVRRLAFHVWVLVNGCVAALPLTFSLWLILEMTQTQGSAVAAQTGAVAISLTSESLALQSQKWLMARVGLQGTMGVSGLAMMLHLALMWSSESVGVVVVSHVGLGFCIALLWVSVRQNALLLATVNDQEREAWASWWCWRVGLCVGSIVWGSCVDVRTSVSHLFKPAAFIAASIALAVATAAVVTRRHGKTRRRVYHTLDLDMAGEDLDEEEDDADEDDWLVKRAKKEGISL